MAITRSQIARQLYRFGGDTMGGPNDKSVGGPGPDDRGTAQQNRNQRAQVRAGNVRTIENLIDRPTIGFTDAARFNITPFPFRGLFNTFTGPDRIEPDDFGSKDQMNLYRQMMAQQAGTMDNVPEEDDEEEKKLEGLRLAFRAEGGIIDEETGRQMYGLGKLVKKATRAVKKVAKSPIGKAAIAYTLTGGLGNLAQGQGFFTNFASPSAFLGGAGSIFSKEGLRNIAFGRPGFYENLANAPGRGVFTKATKGILGSGGALSVGKAITAASLLPLLGIGTGDESEEEAQAIIDKSGLDIDAIRANPNQFLARRFRADGSPKEGEKGIMKVASNDANERLLEQLFEQFLDEGFSPEEAAKKAREAFYDRDFAGAKGGDVEPVAKKTMPLLDMGGQEMDLRAEGGFVPIGRMEKADDVPARLSKNEFVFTADAVRNAGDGDVDKGAEVMYNMMKNLEAGGDVSEESQGLEGAREMFQTSKRLEEVI